MSGSSGSYATYSLPSTFISSLTSGQTVDWQTKVTDGEATTAYSQSPTCHFVADTTAPDQPTVTSATYPDDSNGDALGAAAGTAGSFTFTTSSGSTATKFVYSLDVPPPSSNPPAGDVVNATNNTASVNLTPNATGPHTLYVYAVDSAGDASVSQSYRFWADAHTTASCTSLAACFNNTAISPDSSPTLGGADHGGNSLSATDLTSAGWSSGGKVSIDGATFTLPSYGTGQSDNVLAASQTVAFNGTGNALVFLGTSTNATFSSPGAIANDDTAPYVPENTPITGSYEFTSDTPNAAVPAEGVITYTDGTTSKYFLTVPDWITGPQSLAAIDLPHENTPTGQITTNQPKIYPFAVPINPAKTIQSVGLPDVGSTIGNGSAEQALHIFGMATRDTTTGTPKVDGTTAQAPSGQSWTGSWANPNEGQFNFQGGSFSNQTFRIALTPSISGSTVRIKLDNALGTSKLSIGHATIAQDSGNGVPSAIPSGTPTSLTFGGSQSVTIPEGGSAYSDPLTFPVTANHYLLVSYQLSNTVPYLVQHSFANNTYQYVTATGADDKTTDTTGTPFAAGSGTGTGTLQGYFSDLLTDLDITSDNTPTQAVLGDGLIDPFQPGTTPVTSGSRVSDTLAGAEPTTPTPYGTIAEGIESNQLMTDNPETYNGNTIGGPSALSRIDRDILDQPGLSDVVISEGLEDLLAGSTSDDLEGNGYTTLLQQLQAWGIATTFTSLTPCDGYAGDGATPNDPCTTTVDQNRLDANAWLSATSDGQAWSSPPIFYADYDAAISTTDSGNGEEELTPAADTGDHVNLTNAGYAAEAISILSPHDTWNLDDGDGYPIANDTAPTDTPTTATDTTTGVGQDTLTLNGTTTWTDDPTRGKALSFDGSTGYTSGNPALNTTGSYSVSAWVNPSTLPTTNATVAAQDGTQATAFSLMYDYAHTHSPGWAFVLPDTDEANPTDTVAYAPGATANTWTHLVGIYNATTDTAALYVNGTLTGTATDTTPWNATGPFTIGDDQFAGNPHDFFPGLISHAQAWNYALTPNEVTALYQQVQ